MMDKRVRFSGKDEIHLMYVWKFAYKSARKTYWEVVARDATRFRRRIDITGDILKPILLKKIEASCKYTSEGIVNSYMKIYIDD